MKHLVAVAIIFFASTAHAQTITPAQAKDYAGKHVTVCGKVDDLHMNKINVYLYFGGTRPNQQFEVVITGKATRRAKSKPYQDVWELKGKTVCVTGKIVPVKEHPYLILASLDDLKLQ